MKMKISPEIIEIVKDPICIHWMAYKLAVERARPTIKGYDSVYEELTDELVDFWFENRAHLKSKGFECYPSLHQALDWIKTETITIKEKETKIVVIKIGSDERPANFEDIELAHDMAKIVLDGIEHLRLIVTHHAFDISTLDQIKPHMMKDEFLT